MLLGLSGERFPVQSHSLKSLLFHVVTFFLTLFSVLEELRRAEQELMTSAAIIQHTQQLDFQPCYRDVIFNLQIFELSGNY